MKRIFVFVVLAIALSAATPAEAQKRRVPGSTPVDLKPKKAEAAKSKKASAADSAEASGEAVKTPFGMSKRGEAPPPDTRAQDALVQVTQKGDKYEFRRKTPFGHQVWTKTPDEFDANEKRWVEAAKPKKPKAPASKP